MKKLYYGEHLLPEIPWEYQISNPYFVLLVRSANDYVEMLGSASGFYLNSDGYVKDNNSKANLRLRSTRQSDGTWSDWVNHNNTQYNAWQVNTSRWVGWSNVNIPKGSTTAEEIYFEKSTALRSEDYPMVYYNGMLLPEIPDYFLKSYPYAFIMEQSNRYNLCFSSSAYYFQSSDSTLRPGSSAVNVWLTKADLEAGLTWSYRNSTLYYFTPGTYPIWNNYGINLNGTTGTSVYPKTTPVLKDDLTEPVRIEYLQSSGYQYFDTGVVPDASIEVEVAYSIVNFTNSGPHVLSSGNWYCPYPMGSSKFYTSRLGNELSISVTPSTNTKYTVKAFPNDDILINGTSHATLAAGTTSGTKPLYMFAASVDPDNQVFTGSLKVYYCKIWQNSELVRDFVPVYDTNGKCGMLDKISGTVYHSATSSSFLECNDVIDMGGDDSYEIQRSTLVAIAQALRIRRNEMRLIRPEDIAELILNIK